MSAISGADQNTLRSGPPVVEHYLAIMPRRVVFACSLNKGAATWGETTLPYDNVTVGAWGVVVVGQTLLAYSSVGVYKGKVRVRSIDGSEITIAANFDIEWADDDLLSVVDVWEPWAVPTGLEDTGPGGGIIYYKDTNIAWSSNAAAFPPKANAGVAFAGFLGSGGFVDVEFGGSGWSFANAYGATIATHGWDIADGAYQAGGPATETITARFSTAMFRWIHYAVVDSNGQTGLHRVPVWTFGGDYQPLTDFEVKRRSTDGRDWELVIEAAGEDVDEADIVEGTQVVLFTRTYIGDTEVTDDMSCPFPGRQQVRMVGWILRDSVRWDAETGRVTFTVGTLGKVADDVPGFATFLVSQKVGEAADWHDGERLTFRSAVFFLWHWHTNFTLLAWMGIEPSIAIAGRKFRQQPPFRQIEGDLLLRTFTRLGVTRWGSVHCRYDPQMMDETARAGRATVLDLTSDDWTTEIDFGRSHRPQMSAILGGGIAWDEGAWAGTPYRSRAPGRVGLLGSGKTSRADNLIILSQADLNTKMGLLLGSRANQQSEVTIENWYDVWEPALQEYLTITVAAADNPRGIAFDTDDLWVIRRVEIEDVMGDTPVVRVAAELLVPVGTATGVSVPVPQPPTYPPPPPPPELPPLEPPEEDGTGERILVAGEGGVAYTLDGRTGDPPTWSALNGGLGDSSWGYALALDPLAPERAWVIDGGDDVHRNENWPDGAAWTSVLTDAQALTLIETATGSTPEQVQIVDVKAFDIENATYLFAVCQISWSYADWRVRVLRSTDLGGTWSVGGEIPGFDFGPFTESWEYTIKDGESGWGELTYDPVSGKLWMACRSPRFANFGGKSALNWSLDAGVSWNASAIEGGQDPEDYVGPACADVTTLGRLFVVPWKDLPDDGGCGAAAVTVHRSLICCEDGGTTSTFGDTCTMPATGTYLVTASASYVKNCPNDEEEECLSATANVSARTAPAGPFLFLSEPSPYSGLHYLNIGDVVRFTVGLAGSPDVCCWRVMGSINIYGPVDDPLLTEGEWMVGAGTDPNTEADILEVKQLEADDGYARYRGMLELLADDSWVTMQVENPGTTTSLTNLEVNGALQAVFNHPYRTLKALLTDEYVFAVGRSWLDNESADATDPQLFGLTGNKGATWADKSGNLYTLGMRSITSIEFDWSED